MASHRAAGRARESLGLHAKRFPLWCRVPGLRTAARYGAGLGDGPFGYCVTMRRSNHTYAAIGVFWIPILFATRSSIGDQAACVTCHAPQAAELSGSIHTELRCQECHGGPSDYDLSAERIRAYRTAPAEARPAFDHGDAFSGRPSRSAIPALCGDCHADVERMNVYGIRTDQLARYWTSGHGKTLRDQGDERVAVCTDCHSVHSVLSGGDPNSPTHPFNVPDTCAQCHSNQELMDEYDLPIEVVDEYRRSVHGDLLLNQGDSGAPTCVTCHGNHSAAPPGFANIGTVCGQCHLHAAKYFSESIHADVEEHKGCVQCHGGGEDRHFHLVERITKPSGVLIQRYAHLLARVSDPTPQQISEAMNTTPKKIITNALPTCTDCHDTLEEDESLPKLFGLIDAITAAERRYVQTANRLDQLSTGVLLVEDQRFTFQDAKTHLIGLAPLQHTLDNEKVAAKVDELEAVCSQVNAELDALEHSLSVRRLALIPIWAFAIVFAWMLHVKFKQLEKVYVKPLPRGDRN